MKRKLISYICLISIFMETVPVNALSNLNLKTILQQNIGEESKEPSEPTDKGENSNNDDVAESKEDTSQAEESLPKLEDNVFNMYILDEKELGFSIGFDEKESKFTLSNQSEKQLSKENLDTIIYKINIYDKENKEKLNIELLGSDTGNSEKLNILKETKYEIGDSIKITAFDPKNGLNILGEIQGDINKEKEDYSDGVDNLDYIDNVRFEITETNLKTVYNEAPVFEGLTDILNVENPNIDVLQGVKVTDDHDGEIDNSKIVVGVQEKTEISAILNYTVQDSWGRSTTAIRNVSGETKLDSANVLENNNSAKTTQTQNSIADNIITVEGVPYAGDLTERFKIQFDAASKSIKIIDEDGRILSNTETGEYFKFVLYDKDMEVKASTTLLGSDKSDSEKLEEINNQLFEEGDYIGIWHAESNTKLKIDGTVKGTTKENKQAIVNDSDIKDYRNGLPRADISERRFRIKYAGLEEVNNDAPTIGELESKTIPRGGELELLDGIKEQITDDFDTFNDDSLENGDVSITHTPFDNAKVGEQIITYTATDKWGRSSTQNRTITVTSTNPLDYTYIEFMKDANTEESLFKIKIDPVKKQLLVDNIDNIEDRVIDSSKTSSIFKLKVYTKGGILQKTLNIKGTDKLKTVLRRINGYSYSENDRIELWSTTPENIRVFGELVEDDKTNPNGYKNYEPNENNTNGVDNGDYKENYENGINDADYMKNVRFEIGSTNLKYIYNKAPEFTISTELTTDRKGTVDYMEGITASDDHDNNVTENITYTKIDTSTIGEKYVEYKVVDSWGRSTLIKRKVTVYPYNNLEYNYITIKNNETNEVILSIRFDEDNKKLKVEKLDASKIPSNIDSEDTVLELKLIKKNRNIIFKSSDSVETVNITKQDLTQNNLSDLTDLVYQDGDYLSFNSYDYANGIFISAKSHILLNGFDNEDQMVNSRFEIKPRGLQIIYNSAPEIHGLSDILYVYKGNELTLEKALDGISASDDLDDDISNITVKYNGNALQRTANTINTNEIGNIKLTYEVTDSWGRTTSGERTLSIISKSVSNDIEFYDESGNNKLFSLKYNPISHEFDVTRNESIPPVEGDNQGTEEQPPTGEDNQSSEVVPPVENGEQAPDEAPPTEGDNQGTEGEPPTDENNSDSNVDNNEQIPDNSEAVLNLSSTTGQEEDQEQSGQDQEQQEGQEQGQNQESTPQKDVVFRLNVFNANGQDVGKFELSEEDISRGEGFNQLSNIGVYDDYYFSVWSKKPSRIKIQGDIEGNNTLGESGHENENYADGISNDDHMNNVRFKLRTNGLQAVYNKAPKIIIKNKDILNVYAGDPIDYTSGVIVIDDHDETIPTENITVGFGKNDSEEDKTENDLVIGENTINFSVVDSWGREGTANRTIEITNGISKNEIVIYNNNNYSDDHKVLGIGFNQTTETLVLDKRNNTFNTGRNNDYFKIKVERPNATSGRLETVVSEISFATNDTPNTNNKLQNLESYNFKYGDLITIYHGHPVRFTIDGKVTDSREDYKDGVQNPENLLNTKFEVTQSGLKAVYTNPDENNITNKQNIIGPMAPEKFPFKLKINPETRTISVIDKTGTMILGSAGANLVYKVVLIGQDGTVKKTLSLNGDNWGNRDSDLNNWSNDTQFDYGDALYIWHKDPSRSIIKGNIINKREDYSDGVNDIDNMNNVVFKLTAEGLESVYNQAPEITGVENIDVYQGTPFNVNTDVTYRDDYDTNHLTTSVTGNDVDEDGALNTSELGEKLVTYTATDRWNNTKTVTRKITVRPNLYKNVFKVYSDDNQETPIFEVGFDSITKKYRVFNQTNDKISSKNSTETAFNIRIIGSNKNEKANITLTNNDRGNSPELSKLNEVSYVDGDIIRVYRNNLAGISIEGDVTGDIPSDEDMSNDTNKFDYMMNTGFEVSNNGLKALYNKAPELSGAMEDKVVSKGEVVNLLKGLTVSDDKDTELSTNDIEIYINGSLLSDEENHKSLLSDENIKNYTFDKLGTYNIEYILYDKWGRGILKKVTITVQSKVRDNEIEVYDSNNALAFKVKFDTSENKFVLTNEDTSTTYNSSPTEDKYFEMVVRDIKGKDKYSVTLNGDRAHDTKELEKIHQASFDRYDTIALYGKTAEAVKIQGSVIQENNNSRISNQDYTNGFGNTDRYPLVRFKITDDGLKEITEKNPIVTGIDNTTTIKRGDEIDLLLGIHVDVQDTNNEDYKILVNSTEFNKLEEGTYTVTYTITNSWGYSAEISRSITVEPRTDLEKVKLHLKNTQNQEILVIGFDSIERKLKVFNHRNNATIDSGNSSLAFAINAYDSLGNTLDTIELKGNQQIDESLVNRLNNFNYLEGYRLSIWANNPETHLDLEGNISVSNKDTRKVLRNTEITDIDKMENGRFEILENGLTYIYNKAPEIKGGNTAIDYYKGSILSIPSDITVSDDYDTISPNQVTIDDDDVDYDELGLFDITYMVEDTWGRVGTKQGQINIKSSMDSNVISIYPKTVTRTQDTTTVDSAFDITFVRDEAESKNKIQIEKKSNVEFDSSKREDTFMNIIVYGSNGEKKESANLLGKNNAQDSTELDKLNNFEYDRGDYIAIEGVTEDTKACVRIKGTVVNKREDYTNGVKELDNIQNVRFKFTDLGLESVYNEEPKIIIDKSIILDAAKGDDIPYMRGVKLRDDHGKLTKDNVKVTWNPDEIPNEEYEPYNEFIKGVAKVGINKLHYKVTDSWGRTSEASREVRLSNGILGNSILFKISNGEEMAEFTFEEEDNDASEGKITLKVKSLNTNDIVAPGGNIDYYIVKITELGQDPRTESVHSNNPYNGQFDVFNNKKLPYGSTIEFTQAGHPDRLSISGPVRNQREDYSDGVQNPENIRDVKFVVTDSGIKSVYDPKDQREENQNIITVISKESIPLKLKIDPTTKTIAPYYNSTTTFYWELQGSPEQEVFRITLKGSNGQTKFDLNAKAREKGTEFVNSKFSQPKSYDIGDTLTIWHKAANRISIQGNIDGAREDYSDGVDNSKNLEEAVFTLTANGLEVVYKEAPKIRGLKDTKILKGESFDSDDLNNLISELTATDSIDGDYTEKVIIGEAKQLSEVPSRTIVIDPTSVNTEQVGMYEVKYTVTNSNDRTTRKSSTVIVYDKPQITETNTRIELNSVEYTDEAIKERLKKAVSVTDDDDKLYKKDTKLEVVSHDVVPNREGDYQATYKATDMYGEETTEQITISVTRTINVSVPATIPFQVVTNLKNKEADSFISGVMKVQNNNTSDVNVFIESFARQGSTTNKNGSYKQLEIVEPTSENWETLSQEDSMTKMALGIYNKDGLAVDSDIELTKQNPLWLKEGMESVKLGVLNRADNLRTPRVTKLSFTSKHGKNFIGGSAKGKFNLVFRFE